MEPIEGPLFGDEQEKKSRKSSKLPTPSPSPSPPSTRRTLASPPGSPQSQERSKRSSQLSTWFSSLKRFAPHRLSGRRSKETGKSIGMPSTELNSSHPDIWDAMEHTNSAFATCAKVEHQQHSMSATSSPKHVLLVTSPSLSEPILATGFETETQSIRQRLPSDSDDRDAYGDRTAISAESESSASLDTATTSSWPHQISSETSILRHRQTVLRQHPFFELEVFLREGKDLAAKDSCGTSDPYVKFKIGGKMQYKSKTVSKNLNPEWNERFTIAIEDAFQPVHVKVFDYDWGLQDDFMGAAYLDLSILEPNKPTELSLTLSEPGKSEYMGQILLTATLVPRSQEEKEQYFHKNVKLSESSRRLKSQIWSNVLTVTLVEGKNLGHITSSSSSKDDSVCNLNPCVKFRLGNEKYRSKSITKTCNPQWREQFDLHMYEDQHKTLEVTVCDSTRLRDDVIGKCSIDLNTLEHETTHRVTKDVSNGSGSLFFLLTISGTANCESISDLTSYEISNREKQNLLKRYSLTRTLQNLKDVGHLTVKVYGAEGLPAADLGGKSDPFCVLELVNARLQTQTEYKTLSPSWQKIFTFNIKDINSVLEVTIYDEDRDHKVEFLGKVSIPLLRIKNGDKKWYHLKDKKLTTRAKGQVMLEMEVVFNPLRACIRTFNPREEKYMLQEDKFQRKVFINNVLRVKAIIVMFLDVARYIQSCWDWESPVRSLLAFLIFLLITYYFEIYMLPLALLLLFFVNASPWGVTRTASVVEDDDNVEDDDDDDDKDKEEKTTLKEKLHTIQEVTLSVQKALGSIASLWDRITNTFNFSVPFLSWLAATLLSLLMVVLYYIPLRYLVLAWGINKFTKKLRSPDAIPNNELLDFLSRVPDNEELVMYHELKPPCQMEIDKKGHKKKRST